MSVKEAYFQGGGGVNEPAPKKKKYKSEPALVVQPRFKEPFFRNYDLYNTPGEHSPGAGYHDMEKYKSVQEFLKAKRKRRKGKYKSDDSWQQDDGKRTKKNPNIKARAAMFERIIKTAGSNYDLGKGLYQEMSDGKVDSIKEFREEGDHGPGALMDSNDIDFPIDDQVTGIFSEEGVLPGSEIGKQQLWSEPDFASRTPDTLNFGRDYDDDEVEPDLDEEILQKLFNKYLAPSDTGLFGLPDGVDPEGHDAEPLMDVEQPYAGISDIGTNIYEG